MFVTVLGEIGSHVPNEVFKMCNGLLRLKLNEFFTLADNTRGIRGHSRKLVKFRFTQDSILFKQE